MVAGFLILAALATSATLAAAGGVFEVMQKNRMFHVKELEVARGEIVRFINADEFLHQI